MALVDCPECKWQFSQYAKTCPKCGFPNPLSYYPVSHDKALVEREQTDIQTYEETQYPQEVNIRNQSDVQRVHTYNPPPNTPSPSPKAVQIDPAPQVYVPEEEDRFDNSINGFFHGRSHFWFALCVYYLGGVVALTVAAVALGTPEFMKMLVGGYAFVGLFVLLWTTKNLPHVVSKWSARILIVLVLLIWIGAVPK